MSKIETRLKKLEDIHSLIDDLEYEYPGILDKYLFDFFKVLAQSAKVGKYDLNNWLTPNGHKCDKKNMYASIFRHVAHAFANHKKDSESHLDHRLHAAVRLLMDYSREKHGLVHSDDRGIDK